jgi:hypothetical protein
VGEGEGRGKPDLVWGEGKGLKKALRASRKIVNKQPQEIGGWGYLPECTRDLGDKSHSGLIGRDL